MPLKEPVESTMTPRRTRRTFILEIKSLMIQLYESGKLITDIVRKYDLTTSTVDNQIG